MTIKVSFVESTWRIHRKVTLKVHQPKEKRPVQGHSNLIQRIQISPLARQHVSITQPHHMIRPHIPAYGERFSSSHTRRAEQTLLPRSQTLTGEIRSQPLLKEPRPDTPTSLPDRIHKFTQSIHIYSVQSRTMLIQSATY